MHLDEFRGIVTSLNTPGYEFLNVHGPYVAADVRAASVAGQPGCYAIYDERFRLRYIGMSERAIGARSLNHFSAKVQAAPFWQAAPAHAIDLIPVGAAASPLVLEDFLTTATAHMRSLTWS